MDHKPNLTPILILIALFQGLALLALHQSLELEVWPAVSPGWLIALYSMVIFGPEVLLLTYTREQTTSVVLWTCLYTGVIGALGYYTGTQQHVDRLDLVPGLGMTLAIATFKVVLYIQQVSRGGSLEYRILFRDSWRTALTVTLALLFSLCVSALLLLWAELFAAINIDFFQDLFSSHWFLYPVLSVAHGLGIALLRRQSNLFDTIVGILHILARIILVILCLVSVLFLAALAFTGLGPLWASGGSFLVLWLLALMLFFTNVVYQAEPERRDYPLWLHRAIYVSIVLLPIYSVISGYGLWLRVAQYGWTVERCWAFLIWALLSLFCVGYCLNMLRRRDAWMHGVGRINIALGLVVMLSMLLVNSPLVDFRKISLASQLSRLDRGKVDVEEFDYAYLRYHLAIPGDQALHALRERYADSHPRIALRIDRLLGAASDEEGDASDLQGKALASFGLEREGLPEGLWEALSRDLADELDQGYTTAAQLLPVDLNGDGETDYLLVLHHSSFVEARLFYRKSGHRKSGHLKSEYGKTEHQEAERWWSLDMSIDGPQQEGDDHPVLSEDILPSELVPVLPRWRELQIGKARLSVRPDSKRSLNDQ